MMMVMMMMLARLRYRCIALHLDQGFDSGPAIQCAQTTTVTDGCTTPNSTSVHRAAISILINLCIVVGIEWMLRMPVALGAASDSCTLLVIWMVILMVINVNAAFEIAAITDIATAGAATSFVVVLVI